MANRPVFMSKNTFPYYEIKNVEFEWFPGFSVAQKQRCVGGLHKAFSDLYPGKNVLEVSTKGLVETGKKLSAFVLEYPFMNGDKTLLECVFQGGKVFEFGGPYTDLYQCHPRDAKRDERLKTSGKLQEFRLEGESFPLIPKDFFYSWIYSKALYENKTLLESVRSMGYDSFTDIEFNPEKSINCQAKALAVFKGLVMAGRLDQAMKSKDDFLEIVYQGK